MFVSATTTAVILQSNFPHEMHLNPLLTKPFDMHSMYIVSWSQSQGKLVWLWYEVSPAYGTKPRQVAGLTVALTASQLYYLWFSGKWHCGRIQPKWLSVLFNWPIFQRLVCVRSGHQKPPKREHLGTAAPSVSALTLLVRRQEDHPACEEFITAFYSAVQCSLSAQCPPSSSSSALLLE